ncbi:D-alanyl-D-alanine carboxypeptidase (plasmid) [Aliirhizobium terrae]|uniref:D-alanyl-D-alanine carboxypeptidase family protein n=1 Tax=Terrirhizobium terrae TaxID=2926709 RepID=UPI002577864E|nr:D-alanyl-D-alanine carboxypeptidase family protein [Rhizobium sp. CC-CFT758]WJH37739.1 D-alanyl-D-alanine carboxypeptidase [Rhizobium sp. CC-CFT758]
MTLTECVTNLHRRFIMPLAICVAAVLLPLASASANSKYAGVVVDAATGRVLYADNANARRYPASLTKMMTLYLTFEGLDEKRFGLNTKIRVSRRAASEPPSKLWLRPGSYITVKDAMHALVTKSANDAATALGEFLAGSEAKFATLATRKARSLGMSRTTFRNAHGLPDSRQVTTARDMATLGIALREDFPHRYAIFKTRSYRYGKTTLRSHNRLVGRIEGVDGIKTGYINASGFNLVTSVQRDGRSIVAVVMGGRTSRSRDAHMRSLIASYLPKASENFKRPGRSLLVAKAGARHPTTVPLPLSGIECQRRTRQRRRLSTRSRPQACRQIRVGPYRLAPFPTNKRQLSFSPEQSKYCRRCWER